MRDITTKCGNNAGKIWSVLNEKGCLKKDDIISMTELNEKDFHAGLGWLARENKVSRHDEDCFKIDNTNLDTEIGSHAGRVWKVLDIWGDVDYDSMKRLSDLGDEELHTALGWLACEGKITFDGKNRFNLK